MYSGAEADSCKSTIVTRSSLLSRPVTPSLTKPESKENGIIISVGLRFFSLLKIVNIFEISGLVIVSLEQ